MTIQDVTEKASKLYEGVEDGSIDEKDAKLRMAALKLVLDCIRTAHDQDMEELRDALDELDRRLKEGDGGP